MMLKELVTAHALDHARARVDVEEEEVVDGLALARDGLDQLLPKDAPHHG
eukprot:CAMPEP_0182853778 /NCGR_PEP_ID=MMETSP0034_2-20130328/880_1 /TAXON_ID=156128 /ORGANISM="Nephroselmis pyriformis, Strain CCMP717" /LENGTH=49 /DNA_ID= /DNA_START= /DNA_END= /DNA_ORIENTATION=